MLRLSDTLKFHRNGLLIVLAVYLIGVYPVFCLSESLPQYIFLLNNHHKTFKRDGFIFFKAALPGEQQKTALIKQIKGVPGDRIAWRNNACYVNDELIGSAKLKATNGVELSRLKEQIIPPGKIFVAGTHPRSFDSRYQNLGLIDIDQVKTVYALF